MRHYNNNRGEGCVFSIELLDCLGGEIRGTFFNDEAKKFFDKLENGKCYVIRKGSIRVANKRYSKSDNEFEITFNYNTTFKEEEDDIGIKVKKLYFLSFLISRLNLVQIKDLPSKKDLELVDILAFVISTQPSEMI
jgi:replication factor A1